MEDFSSLSVLLSCHLFGRSFLVNYLTWEQVDSLLPIMRPLACGE